MALSASEVRLLPLSSSPEAALQLTSEAVEEAARKALPAEEPGPRIAFLSERLRAGTMPGRLYGIDRATAGVVLWDEENASFPGLRVQVLGLDRRFASESEYGRFLGRIAAEIGPVMYLPAGLPGLTAEVESRFASGRGFARFGRSEMRLPDGTPLPTTPHPPGVRIRPLRPEDEPTVATLHAAAFGRHFDFYLYRRNADPHRNSEMEVHDMMHGRWGELLPWASSLAEQEDGRACGVCLFVRAPYGPLLISLGVDPSAQGQGVGRALTAASVRALRERGEKAITLNVTEGNRRAVAMYERFGFVRTIGPEWAWFSTELVPVAPDGSPSRPASRVDLPSAASRDGAGNRTRPA